MTRKPAQTDQAEDELRQVLDQAEIGDRPVTEIEDGDDDGIDTTPWEEVTDEDEDEDEDDFDDEEDDWDDDDEDDWDDDDDDDWEDDEDDDGVD